MTLSDAGAVPATRSQLDGRSERVAGIPFSAVYEEHATAVYRFCLSQVGDATAAEDITSEAFSNAYAAYKGVDPDADGVRRWIFTIARNAAADHRRRQWRWSRLVVGSADGRPCSNVTPAADVETVVGLREELRTALAAVRGLNNRDRGLVGLRIAGGLSYAEIASVMGISEHAARTATHRALVRVRGVLEGQR